MMSPELFLVPVELSDGDEGDWEYLLTLDGMPDYHRVPLNITFAGMHLYTWLLGGRLCKP